MQWLPCLAAPPSMRKVVVCDDDGKPDFDALMLRSTENLCSWCFDLLSLDGRDLRPKPLTERKGLLRSTSSSPLTTTHFATPMNSRMPRSF